MNLAKFPIGKIAPLEAPCTLRGPTFLSAAGWRQQSGPACARASSALLRRQSRAKTCCRTAAATWSATPGPRRRTGTGGGAPLSPVRRIAVVGLPPRRSTSCGWIEGIIRK